MVGLAPVRDLLAPVRPRWSAAALDRFRRCQGAAGAILSPSVFSITLVTFEEGAERNKALGILGAIAGSGAAIGVLLGGVLTEYAGLAVDLLRQRPDRRWRALLRPARRAREPGRRPGRHFDAAGAVTVTASLMLLVYGLTQAPTIGWTSAETIGASSRGRVLWPPSSSSRCARRRRSCRSASSAAAR